MITGVVTPDEEPVVSLVVAGATWPAVIDTGFNGELQLPEGLRPHVNARPQGELLSVLADGQTILEDVYLVDFPFDGEVMTAEATFVPDGPMLLGTHLLRRHRLTIDFPAQTVLLERHL